MAIEKCYDNSFKEQVSMKDITLYYYYCGSEILNVINILGIIVKESYLFGICVVWSCVFSKEWLLLC